jgi:hypothetical protein
VTSMMHTTAELTESYWLSSTNAAELVECIRGRVSDRKCRLLAVALCRRLSKYLPDPESQAALDVAERWAEGSPSSLELTAARVGAWQVVVRDSPDNFESPIAHLDLGEYYPFPVMRGPREACASYEYGRLAWVVLLENAWAAAASVVYAGIDGGAWQARVVREIIGNPFRKNAMEGSLLVRDDQSVECLAQEIYDQRSFERLPALAETLKDAGFDNADILSHLCGPAKHVRGCWALDQLLGKE